MHRRHHLADLIEKDGPSIRNFDFSLLLSHRTRKCASFVSEELAFQQRFRQRSTIDRHERPVVAAAVAMNRPRHQFLARTAFTTDQHGRIRGSDLSNELKYFPHARTFANHIVFDIDLFLKTLVFAFEPFHVPCMLQCDRGD